MCMYSPCAIHIYVYKHWVHQETPKAPTSGPETWHMSSLHIKRDFQSLTSHYFVTTVTRRLALRPPDYPNKAISRYTGAVLQHIMRT